MDAMNDFTDDGSFMFTSESVGEGHPGEALSITFFFLHCSVKSRCNFLNCVAQHVQTAQQLLADSAVYLLQQVLVERVRQCLLISLT